MLELRGYPCANLEQDTQAKQQIICSRSFGERITHMNSMHQALAGYMERAAEKLRAEGMCCRHATLFIRTSPFNDKEPYYGNQVSTKLAVPTNDTRALLEQDGSSDIRVRALRCPESVYTQAGISVHFKPE
ncbi:hypothetical protein KAM351_46250 [Aeromonas caviae]|uniref:DNA polymerase Y-family little finger domain-containing protein n=1 Tax=Aeromonas caviae TaxID=648 RepID=A0AA37D1J9_AERCA|nr:hypothetical protein KAM351_46250 [Aeromonas caviae]